MDSRAMSIIFEKHRGVQNLDDGFVIFYNLIFDSILDAAQFLKKTDSGRFKGKYLRGNKYLINSATDEYYDGALWKSGWKSLKQKVSQANQM